MGPGLKFSFISVTEGFGGNKYSTDEFVDALQTLSVGIADRISEAEGIPEGLSFDAAFVFHCSSMISQKRNEVPDFFFEVLQHACNPFRAGKSIYQENFVFQCKTCIAIHKAILKVRLAPSANYNSTIKEIKEDLRKQVIGSKVALEAFVKVCLLLIGVEKNIPFV